MTYARHLKTPARIPQSQPVPGREAEMEKNPAGGYAFTSDSLRRAHRFLMLGAEGGTYYEGEKALTKQAAKAILEVMAAGNKATSDLILDIARISDGGQAQSNSPAIFALAMICAFSQDEAVRLQAWGHLAKVCRTGTHLFEFIDAYVTLRNSKSMGRMARTAVSNWYNQRKPKDIAYQIIKYQQREGWAQRDVLRLDHVKVDDTEKKWLMAYAAGKTVEFPTMSRNPDARTYEGIHFVGAFETIKTAENLKDVVRLITENRLPREAVPTQWLNAPEVWEALLPDMNYMALMRNLPKLTELGFFDLFKSQKGSVSAQLTSREQIKRSRVHPLAILLAKQTYQTGVSLRGSKTWTPSGAIIGALEDAFYLAMDNITPVESNTVLAIDCSGSMTNPVNGVPNMSAREVSVAFALCYLKGNPKAEIMGFTQRPHDLSAIHAGMRLNEALDVVNRRVIGEGTDCSVVFEWALANRIPADNFLMFTDSMTWAGSEHPHRAIDKYRKHFKPQAKWVLVQTTATGTQIQDSKDVNAMEFAGFAPSMFTVANEFFAGNL